jgi:methyl coenzyme M reductase subunit C-like uncharacterized protein (methanogenesis marker protein 7)
MVSTAPTMAVLAKEAMNNMSDTLNTKEELEEFIKSMMKKIITKKKEEEKAAKPKVAKPKVVKHEVAKPVVEKLVMPPSKRKIFYDEMRVKIQDEFPELNPKQTEQKLADLWRIHVEELFEWKTM